MQSEKNLQSKDLFSENKIMFLNDQRISKIVVVKEGNGELLELRLLETGFLSRFQLNP